MIQQQVLEKAIRLYWRSGKVDKLSRLILGVLRRMRFFALFPYFP